MTLAAQPRLYCYVRCPLTSPASPLLLWMLPSLVWSEYAVAEDGRLYTWGGDKGGLEVSFAALGLGLETNWTQAAALYCLYASQQHALCTILAVNSWLAQGEKSVDAPHTPSLVSALSHKFIVTVDCGGYHTACIDGKQCSEVAADGCMMQTAGSCTLGDSGIEASSGTATQWIVSHLPW